MKKILVLMIFAMSFEGCLFKTPTDGANVIQKSDSVKVISYELFAAYYDAEIDKITYEITYAGLSETDAWARKKALDLRAMKYKKVLKLTQEVQTLLAVALDAKKVNPNDPQSAQKITEYTVRLMGLVGELSSIIAEVKGEEK